MGKGAEEMIAGLPLEFRQENIIIKRRDESKYFKFCIFNASDSLYSESGIKLIVEIYRGGPLTIISDSIGHINNLITNVILLTLNNFFKRTPTRDHLETVLTRYAEEGFPWQGHVLVRMGHTRLFDEIRRLFIGNSPQPLLLWRILSLFSVPFQWLWLNFFRADCYNPMTRTVHIYHDRKCILLHELGHAEDFGTREFPGWYAWWSRIPIMDLIPEYRASKRAVRYCDKAEEKKFNNVLMPAFGSYIDHSVVGLLKFIFFLWPVVIIMHILARIFGVRIFKAQSGNAGG